MENVHEWFKHNSVTANSDIFQFIILGNKGSHWFQTDDNIIKSTSFAMLVGITIFSKLNFKEHTDNTIQKAYYDLYALRRLRKFSALEIAKSQQVPWLRMALSTVHWFGCLAKKQICKG